MVRVGSSIVVKWANGQTVNAQVIRIHGKPGDQWRMAEVRRHDLGLEYAHVPLHRDEVADGR
jgi:hypothetical protein